MVHFKVFHTGPSSLQVLVTMSYHIALPTPKVVGKVVSIQAVSVLAGLIGTNFDANPANGARNNEEIKARSVIFQAPETPFPWVRVAHSGGSASRQ